VNGLYQIIAARGRGSVARKHWAGFRWWLAGASGLSVVTAVQCCLSHCVLFYQGGASVFFEQSFAQDRVAERTARSGGRFAGEWADATATAPAGRYGEQGTAGMGW